MQVPPNTRGHCGRGTNKPSIFKDNKVYKWQSVMEIDNRKEELNRYVSHSMVYSRSNNTFK